MAKRVTDDAPGEQLPAEAAPVGENPIYSLGKWGEFTQWQCRFCAFDTVQSEQTILDHYAQVHAPAPVVQPHQILVSDRYGNPVEGV